MRMGFDTPTPRRCRPPYVKKRVRRTVLAVCICLILLTALCLAVKILLHARPLVLQMAQNRAGDIMVCVINDAISEQIAKIQADSAFAEFSADENGYITASYVDTLKINAVKSDILKSIEEKLQSYDTIEVSVPLGAVLDLELFCNIRPQIKFAMISTGSFNADFSSSFTSAGINQTKHEVNITISGELGVISVLGSCTSEVSTTVPVVQTIISGDVPVGYIPKTDAEY